MSTIERMLRDGTTELGSAIVARFGEVLESQRHLDDGTVEQAYWHAGYLAAMKSVLANIEDGVSKWPLADATASSSEVAESTPRSSGKGT